MVSLSLGGMEGLVGVLRGRVGYVGGGCRGGMGNFEAWVDLVEFKEA